ncbi:hypothetical protein [Tsukamurella sp. 1534]|uniref:hypothetical protein n=1 Tax=Tsukamurella sp. 1534 TaxID=1151061 RepID=UPI0005940196|nr:hypothetical protein [Tsukamurella sp. 1534]
MKRTTRVAAVAMIATALFGIGGTAYGDPPPPPPKPGTSCGVNKVITSINTCAQINSHCTGYDMMLIGRVDKFGHCVIPGMNGTTW